MPLWIVGKDFDPAPEGIHLAWSIDTIDRGMVEKTYKGVVTLVREVQLVWEIPVPLPRRPEENFRPRRNFPSTLKFNSNLRKFLVPWRGRDFTPAEERRFDIESVIGVPCQLQIVHRAGREGQIWANVVSALPVPKLPDGSPYPMFTPQPYVRVKDRISDTPDHQETPPTENDPVPF